MQTLPAGSGKVDGIDAQCGRARRRLCRPIARDSAPPGAGAESRRCDQVRFIKFTLNAGAREGARGDCRWAWRPAVAAAPKGHKSCKSYGPTRPHAPPCAHARACGGGRGASRRISIFTLSKSRGTTAARTRPAGRSPRRARPWRRSAAGRRKPPVASHGSAQAGTTGRAALTGTKPIGKREPLRTGDGTGRLNCGRFSFDSTGRGLS